ncbi:undecaprenyl-diphosphate phosphatase [Bacillus smithii]|uniref:Undecaprenyl-diphosphatase n=1 Tax=Bacillus smithii 7_3_47FAA TaxID=665952 RepID=G9QNU3_9BACI|nr:undecaprenyl-diphosphate phosphatase [Bacillus smithii]EHL74915.1 undecaprenyl-diphosphatase UppP [Bacillus smithii 7_3_47FAA]
MLEVIKAIVLGCVEGLTEFLPISSTGHLILVGHFLSFTGDKAKTFEIVIQLGSILAVVVLYFKRFLSLFNFKKRSGLNLLHIIIGMIPASVLGFLFHDVIKNVLFSPFTVGIGLFLGAFLMIYAEKKSKTESTQDLDHLSYKQAFIIGLYQCLSLWPGFSRAGSTISGGLLAGANHKTAAEYSFLLAVPMMVAASGLDLLKSYQYLSIHDLNYFATGFITAFIVAMLAIVFFLKILSKVKLIPFAIYRIIIGIIVIAYFI